MTPAPEEPEGWEGAAARMELRCRGVVQGLGVRPALYRLARELGLGGILSNQAEDLQLDLWGSRRGLERFLERMAGALPPGVYLEAAAPRWSAAPPGAERCGVEAPCAGGAAAWESELSLRITAAELPGVSLPLAVGLAARGLAADRAPCQACRRELADPTNRRYGDPFLSCCQCGPRYTIATALPWRRAHTTLAPFTPCAACAAEFHDPTNRRFHAETIGCPRCGPRLTLLEGNGEPWPSLPPRARSGTSIAAAAALLEQGLILALQGVGGFQLLVDGTNAGAVARLRSRKRRPFRPFALLVADPAWVEPVVEVSSSARELLGSPAAPIVLLPRRAAAAPPGATGGDMARDAGADPAADLYPGVASGCPQLGVMLPATPLHLLLVQCFGRPLVCTSGNRSGEPLCANAPEALRQLAGVADAFLLHDRPVARPLDDSVAQLVEGKAVLLRRARGHAPEPLLPRNPRLRDGVLALGGDLKAAPALALDGRVWLAPHLGDLSQRAVLARWRAGIEEWLAQEGERLTSVAFDAHPGYVSHQLALSLPLKPQVVQHHVAHGLAVVAERELSLPVLAFCADGLGYGMTREGAGPGAQSPLWGGELLLLHPGGAERLGWLRPLALPGGERTMVEPRRAALGLLHAAGPWALAHPGAAACRGAFDPREWEALAVALQRGVNCLTTSSVGRLFDAAASLLGLCQFNSCEGEAALRLQGAAVWAAARRAPSPTVRQTAEGAAAEGRQGQALIGALRPVVVDWEPLLRQLLAERRSGMEPAFSALGFHRALARGIALPLAELARQRGVATVVLSGGCFQNTLLLELLVGLLRRRGLEPHWAGAAPANDGGLALGQLWASHLRSSKGTFCS